MTYENWFLSRRCGKNEYIALLAYLNYLFTDSEFLYLHSCTRTGFLLGDVAKMNMSHFLCIEIIYSQTRSSYSSIVAWKLKGEKAILCSKNKGIHNQEKLYQSRK